MTETTFGSTTGSNERTQFQTMRIVSVHEQRIEQHNKRSKEMKTVSETGMLSSNQARVRRHAMRVPNWYSVNLSGCIVMTLSLAQETEAQLRAALEIATGGHQGCRPGADSAKKRAHRWTGAKAQVQGKTWSLIQLN